MTSQESRHFLTTQLCARKGVARRENHNNSARIGSCTGGLNVHWPRCHPLYDELVWSWHPSSSTTGHDQYQEAGALAGARRCSDAAESRRINVRKMKQTEQWNGQTSDQLFTYNIIQYNVRLLIGLT